MQYFPYILSAALLLKFLQVSTEAVGFSPGVTAERHEVYLKHALENIRVMDDVGIGGDFRQRQRLDDPDADNDPDEPVRPNKVVLRKPGKASHDRPSLPPPKPLIIKSHPVLTSSSFPGNIPMLKVKLHNNHRKPGSGTPSGSSTQTHNKGPSEESPEYTKGSIMPSSEGFLNTFHNIKDAYFEVLDKLRDFRTNVSKRFEMLEEKLEEAQKTMNRSVDIPLHQMSQESPAATMSPEMEGLSVPNLYSRIMELERRYNISRLVDQCVYYILASNLEDALKHWGKLEAMMTPNVSEQLRDIVKLVYSRNSSNTSPIYPFLRRLQGVEKMPLYSVLINGMKLRENFDGVEIFYMAQYLKERNAVRSSLYSKIPKAVQYAVSGRNVNIVYFDLRSGRNYLHVRDDQDRTNRLNFYIQASQSYTDTRAAVWNVIFEPSSETFRIRNALFGDYMYVNDEGFLETLHSSAVRPGTEFSFVLEGEKVVIHCKGHKNEPLVVIRGGGKYPYYFSLARENPHTPIAMFLVEPDTLL